MYTEEGGMACLWIALEGSTFGLKIWHPEEEDFKVTESIHKIILCLETNPVNACTVVTKYSN